MRVLLDTHILIWALGRSRQLGADTLALLEDEATEVFFSAVSIWEIAIKWRLGRTDFRVRPEVILHAAGKVGFIEVPVRAEVTLGVADLPLHHGDPFDRLLVAQAMAGPMRLLTSDPILRQYLELVTLVG